MFVVYCCDNNTQLWSTTKCFGSTIIMHTVCPNCNAVAYIYFLNVSSVNRTTENYIPVE